jgi:hypothetical protein
MLRCSALCELMPECIVCHKTKKPYGRDAPPSSNYCDSDCPAYQSSPKAGHLWPGELAQMDAPPEDE